MQIKKGAYGYRDNNRMMRLLITGILLAAVLIQLIVRHFISNTATKNILTVMAILTVLPMANMASPLIASWKYRTSSADFHNRVARQEGKCIILYDLVLTSKADIMPMDAIGVHPLGVFCYCSKGSIQAEAAETYLNEMLSAQKLTPNARVIKDEGAFHRRLEHLKPASEYEDDGSIPYVVALLKSLSM